jgi:hypothetical protein
MYSVLVAEVVVSHVNDVKMYEQTNISGCLSSRSKIIHSLVIRERTTCANWTMSVGLNERPLLGLVAVCAKQT